LFQILCFNAKNEIDRTRAKWHKFKTSNFHLNTRKHLLLWRWSNTGTGWPERLRNLHH